MSWRKITWEKIVPILDKNDPEQLRLSTLLKDLIEKDDGYYMHTPY